jgi:hypothetical protein
MVKLAEARRPVLDAWDRYKGLKDEIRGFPALGELYRARAELR